MRFPAKTTLSCIWVAIPVDWVILHWFTCGADGQSGVWPHDYQIFSDYLDYFIFLPMVLCCTRFAPKSSANKANFIASLTR